MEIEIPKFQQPEISSEENMPETKPEKNASEIKKEIFPDKEKEAPKTDIEIKRENQKEIKKETEFEKDVKEMEKKEEELRPEIEAKFKDALKLLHLRIQLTKESEKSFPSKDKLRELIEGISVFAQMQEGAKQMFVSALQTTKEFRSEDEYVFVEKGMEFMGLFIALEAAKRAGEIWLQEKMMQAQAGKMENIGPEKTMEFKEIPPKEIPYGVSQQISKETNEKI